MAVKAMETKVNIQHYKLIHLEDSLVMYGVYNAETLEKLISTVHQRYNTTTPNERLFAGELSTAFIWYVIKNRVNHYAINLLLYLRILYIKGYLPVSLISPTKLQEILNAV